MGLCGTKQGNRHSYTTDVLRPPNKEFITAFQDACFGDQDTVGFAALPAVQQLKADPSSYAQEHFYAKLGNKVPAMLARLASNPHLKDGCLSPEHAVEQLMGKGIDHSLMLKYRMARLFEAAMHPELAVTPFTFLSFGSLIDSGEMSQFFVFFADFDEDHLISSDDMMKVITGVTEFASNCQPNALPEELQAFTSLSQEDRERGQTQWLLQFETPKNRRECKQWFEAYTIELPPAPSVKSDDVQHVHESLSEKLTEFGRPGLPDAGVAAFAAH